MRVSPGNNTRSYSTQQAGQNDDTHWMWRLPLDQTREVHAGRQAEQIPGKRTQHPRAPPGEFLPSKFCHCVPITLSKFCHYLHTTTPSHPAVLERILGQCERHGRGALGRVLPKVSRLTLGLYVHQRQPDHQPWLERRRGHRSSE